MQNTIKVLDHGLVTLLNIGGPIRRLDQPFDGADVDPAKTARMSFNNFNDPDRTEKDDLSLCNYLLKNWHTTPFEMLEIWVEMKLPIFVARQYVRHRTATINEVSGRYVQLPAEWYIPDVVGGKAPNVKQGQADNLSKAEQEIFRKNLDRHCQNGYLHYEAALVAGVAPEHARLLLSLNHYTHWVWKQDLHNMMHLMQLRIDSHAQVEAQAYANALRELLGRYLPRSMELFDKYRREFK